MLALMLSTYIELEQLLECLLDRCTSTYKRTTLKKDICAYHKETDALQLVGVQFHEKEVEGMFSSLFTAIIEHSLAVMMGSVSTIFNKKQVVRTK